MSRRSRWRAFVVLAAASLGAGAAILRLNRTPRAIQATSLTNESLAMAQRGYRSVPAIFAARFLAKRLSGRPSLRVAALSVLLAASWPVLLDIATLFVSPTVALHGASVLPGCLILTATNFLMLAAAWWGWRMFIDAAVEIDELLELSAEKLQLRSWIDRRMSRTKQITTCAVLVAVVVVAREIHSAHVSLMSQIFVGWSVAIGGNTLYWIISWAEGPARLYRCTSLRLHWYDSTRTPGIRSLQRIYSFIAITLGMGVFSAEGFSLLIAGKYGSAMPEVFWTLLPSGLAVLALYAGAGPFFFLYLIMRRERETVLRRIGERLDRFSSNQIDHPNVRGIMESYAYISSLSTWPLTSSAVAQYVAAVVGSLLAYALGRF